ncbi:hypothetical protein FJT64_009478 [Amphibalanus amphitrite]|uniref:Uncharacterized protein n=1 Tax=Amphibalanus amphitrite TaxID=1232801 RepID=A0A6A4V8E3_AMPAM|nr:hypothetical protein FJT64_009478 [Amphibalanus amphitrite]
MLLRVYRMMQGLPGRTQKMVTYVMLGALPCRVEETLEHFLYECGELQEERRMAEIRTRSRLTRNRAAVETLMDAGLQEASLIHQIYKARVEKELNQSSPHGHS